MKAWIEKAVEFLEDSLSPPPHEINELDWKAALSPDKKRLTEHLCAFANQSGGGFFAYGISSTAVPKGVTALEIEEITTHLSNLARQGVEPPVTLDHAVHNIGSIPVLFVFVKESSIKPVHLRKQSVEASFIRCSGTTRSASKPEVGSMLMHSKPSRWEDLRASLLLSEAKVLWALNGNAISKLLEIPYPSSDEECLLWMESEGLIEREPSGGCYITNLGAISAARDISEFDGLNRKAARVVVYSGPNKSVTKFEQPGTMGYAISFRGLLGFVMKQLPQSELIEKALRVKRTVYPEIALRELIANALIHQDFQVTGAGPMIEIFSNRIEISSPGKLLPSKRIDRLIGTQAESRNERLAKAFRMYKICEERGSGLFKAGIEVELYGLPPIKFEAGENHFKVTLQSPKTFAQMSAKERLEACYQHAVLRHYSADFLTNSSLRERLKMPVGQRSMVSVLIQESVNAGKIRPADPDSTSKKHAKYVPHWA